MIKRNDITDEQLYFAVFCITALSRNLGIIPSDVYNLITEKTKILDEYISKWVEITPQASPGSRQYITGKLSLPQVLNYIEDENVEIGISRYKEYKIEKPHYHTEVSEYHIILEGETKYVNITENEEYIFEKGDFYIIRPNTVYIQKSIPGTQIMFIKVPGKNDKISCEITEKMELWFKEWSNTWN